MKIKRHLKNWANSRRLSYRKWRYAFSANELLDALGRAGIEQGDTLLVHSSYDSLAAFKGMPSDVIAVLRSAVGEAGTVLMPTIPFNGTALAYAHEGRVFDVRRTPAQVGLLPEIYRRMPGVQRSLHPTHSVAGAGRLATALLNGHEKSDTPCDSHTPYGRLAIVGGKNLFLGVTIESMTFYHFIESVLEQDMPFSPFTTERYEFRCKDLRGDETMVRCRLFEPSVSRRRIVSRLEPELRQLGAWREASVGDLNILAVSAEDALRAAKKLADRGEFCYGA